MVEGPAGGSVSKVKAMEGPGIRSGGVEGEVWVVVSQAVSDVIVGV